MKRSSAGAGCMKRLRVSGSLMVTWMMSLPGCWGSTVDVPGSCACDAGLSYPESGAKVPPASSGQAPWSPIYGDGGTPAVVQLPATDGGSCTTEEVCSLGEAPVPPPTSAADMVSMMTGDWALCGTTSVFGTQEAGFSFVADGTWYKLYSRGGQLVRGLGVDEQGTWAIIDASVMNGPGSEPQLNLTLAGGGGIGLFPAFATNPRKMRLNNEGVYVADYVLAACP